MAAIEAVAGSFRDPSGFVFRSDGALHRQVNESYRAAWRALHDSGLYRRLVDDGLLIPHVEVPSALAPAPRAYKVVRPEPIPFVSYPYEWSFSQLQDAALATLRIQQCALDREMTLKDASAYNIQFRDGRPVLIDTLSFEPYREGAPWIAYRQFCQHFLAPLALMSLCDVRLSQLLRVHVDGVPLDLASRLLPRRSRFRFGLLTHVHLHARSQSRHAGRAREGQAKAARVSRTGMRGLIASLEATVRGLAWRPAGTEWGDYYEDTNYTAAGAEHKAALVREFAASVTPKTVWDLGANTGVFSRLAVESGADVVVAWDLDPAAVEKSYRRVRREGPARLLPLLLDLANPSPALGWAGEERMSLAQRGPVDLVMALALIHHLAISNNVPLDRIADFLAPLAPHLIIEFVPKQDSQVRRLLANREDVFDGYTRAGFERAFARRYETIAAHSIRDGERTLYLLRRKAA